MKWNEIYVVRFLYYKVNVLHCASSTNNDNGYENK